MVKSRGEVLYLGTAHKDIVFPPETFERIVRNELCIYGSWNSYSAPYPGKEWREIIRYLEEKKLSFESLITQTYPLERMPQVIEQMAGRQFPYIKVLFEITEG